ncbi:ferritin-like domain-containing protein [Rhodococcus sp. BP-349]|uniref:ferritin-like domain-containing protein n=1 Tax=unclassified Rhodococcus (in: high G+C Gram-positive bacteria) TaxID=192944 RepID=UPI001C9A87EA|nr:MULTISPECIES: ferritin-like domain-containing protein [unclassified Rhodococcus (in: high G+C Gram-positive bacteria)]MBY6540937.1 ferritin-like domain-containing protein [Rhodococcus sp. BP-363]MBY6545037.1 ferritin-like domain-containing protein [Rhodococcus sp. BP-369]MBY6564267.1 ferritin-like domain-containing protein [Rhodococcus sp. BP-370]MBY6578796.1 ferritin-like domain-containing protein [Rhodococcus sp. BP-364]MBY6588097.1 ferritin-like domain-containing protein [Rhodococcus sp.
MSDLGPEQQALVDALNVEFAAVFAYGLIAAFSNPTRDPMVAQYAADHRARRDGTIDALTAASVTAPEPAAGYTVPFPVTDAVAAAQLAAQVEDDAAIAWRSVIERAQSGHTRDIGIVALTDSARRASAWKAILGIFPSTVAFPGTPAV